MSFKAVSKPLIIAAAASTVVVGVSGYVWQAEHRPARLEIYIFALKSGRSLFIRTPEDRRVLIDGGGNSSIIRELTKIIPFYSRRIDTIIATHTDGKNVAGLIDILERYSVSSVYIPGLTQESLQLASSTDKTYETFIETLHAKDIGVHELTAGDRVTISTSTLVEVLFPAQADAFEYSKASSPELLFKVVYNINSFIFLGDSSKKVQKYIATSTFLGNTDAVYLSNSASPADVSAELFDVLRPTSLIYSKALSKNPSTKSKKPSKKTNTKKKEPLDPLASILIENRYNLKEKGTVKLIFDGVQMNVVVDE